MTDTNSYTQAITAGDLKQNYAKTLAAFKPPDVHLQMKWKFDESAREGDKFNQMVALTQSNGFTKAGAATIRTTYNLNLPVPTYSGNATVQATETIGREWVPYGMMYASQGNDSHSMVDIWEFATQNLSRSSGKRQEYELLYGGPVNPVGQTISGMTATIQLSAGLGEIASMSRSSNVVSGTITLTTWSPGIFGGLEKALLDVVDAAVATPIVLNTNAAVELTTVDLGTRAVTLTTSTAAGNADAVAIAAATHPILYFYGYYGQESLGLRSILSAGNGSTSSQSLFGIPLKTFSYWDPSTFNCNAGPLTMQKVFSMVTIGNARGLYGRVFQMVPSSSWMDMNQDATSYRRFDSSYKQDEMRTGFDKLVYVSQAGELELVPSLYLKCGDTVLCDGNEGTWRRTGSTDVTFELPGGQSPILDIPDRAGRELRDFWAIAPFTPMPSRNVWGHNILPNTTPS
jgi:hypothetical protein